MIGANEIQVSSVHTFKGLESRVVILAEVDSEASHILDSVLYVGCSRARTYLVILYDSAIDEKTRFCQRSGSVRTPTKGARLRRILVACESRLPLWKWRRQSHAALGPTR